MISRITVFHPQSSSNIIDLSKCENKDGKKDHIFPKKKGAIRKGEKKPSSFPVCLKRRRICSRSCEIRPWGLLRGERKKKRKEKWHLLPSGGREKEGGRGWEKRKKQVEKKKHKRAFRPARIVRYIFISIDRKWIATCQRKFRVATLGAYQEKQSSCSSKTTWRKKQALL